MQTKSTQEVLNNIGTLLGSICGPAPVQKTASMEPEQFVAYAVEQVSKAQGENSDRSRMRLTALRAEVVKASAWFDSGTEKLTVTTFSEDTTAADELSAKEITPQSAASANFAGFTSADPLGFKKRVDELSKQIATLKGDAPVEVETAAGDEHDDDRAWPDDLNLKVAKNGEDDHFGADPV